MLVGRAVGHLRGVLLFRDTGMASVSPSNRVEKGCNSDASLVWVDVLAYELFNEVTLVCLLIVIFFVANGYLR